MLSVQESSRPNFTQLKEYFEVLESQGFIPKANQPGGSQQGVSHFNTFDPQRNSSEANQQSAYPKYHSGVNSLQQYNVSPASHFMPQPGMGNMPQPGIGNMPQPGIGNMPQPGIGNMPQPGIGNMPQPGVNNLPQPGMNNMLQPGIGNMAQPGMNNMPQFGIQNQGQRSLKDLSRSKEFLAQYGSLNSKYSVAIDLQLKDQLDALHENINKSSFDYLELDEVLKFTKETQGIKENTKIKVYSTNEEFAQTLLMKQNYMNVHEFADFKKDIAIIREILRYELKAKGETCTGCNSYLLFYGKCKHRYCCLLYTSPSPRDS